MKTRAAVLEEFGEPLVVQELELTEPRQGEALVRLVACGVCHTDLYTASGVDPPGYAPTTVCLAIRDQENGGYLPDATTRLRRDGEEIRHFMGTATFAQHTVMPEI